MQKNRCSRVHRHHCLILKAMVQEAISSCGILHAIHGNWMHGRITSSNRAELATVAITFSIIFFMILWCWWRRERFLLPPGPRGWPLVKILPLLSSNPHRRFAELAQIYGPIMSLRMGARLFVVISSPSVARDVCKHDDIIFSNHDQPIAAMVMSYGGSSLMRCPHGPTWRALRRVFHHVLLSNKKLEVFYHLRQREVLQMVHEIYSKKGTPINVGKLAYATFFNLLTSMLWGGTLNQQGSGAEFSQLVSETVQLLTRPNISDYLPALAWFDVQGIERRMRKCVSKLDRVYEALMEKRVRDSATVESTDILSILLKITDDAKPRMPLTNNNLKGLITDIMVGGTSTMSTTVEWMMAELMHKPHIMRRAREELMAVVGREVAVEEGLVSQLHYLKAVMKETLRVHAVAPLLVPRVPSRSCTVAGYVIPKGACVITNVWAIHRDPEVWKEPLDFRPERFLGTNGSPDDFAFFPFGSGRRICAGIPLVEKVVPLVVATLLHLFEWQLPEGEELDLCERLGVTLSKASPLIAIPTPRLSNQEIYVYL